MKTFLIEAVGILFLFFLSADLLGQAILPPAQALESITTDEMRMHLTFLASDALQGRGNGQYGGKVSWEYLAWYFDKLGLKPFCGQDFRHPFNYYESQLTDQQTVALILNDGKTNRQIDGKYYGDFFVQFERSDNFSLSAELCFAGYGISAPELEWNDYDSSEINGKAVVVFHNLPDLRDDKGELIFGRKAGVYRNPLQKVKWAKRAGARVLIIVMSDEEFRIMAPKYRRSLTLTENYISEQEIQRLPIIFISESYARSLFAFSGRSVHEVRQQILDTREPVHFNFTGAKVKIDIRFQMKMVENSNVLAYKEGTDPQLKNEYVFITAHYDHLGIKDGQIYNGADDNASGVTGMLEIANAFKEHITDNKRSIVFAAFGGEEFGLLGSTHFINHCPIPRKKMVACLNLDMIGREENSQLYVFGINYCPDLKLLNEKCNDYTGFFLNYNGQVYSRKSDQWPFVLNHVPSLFYFTGMHDNYHKPTDDFDKIDFDGLVRVSRLACIVAYNLCQTDLKPKYLPRRYWSW